MRPFISGKGVWVEAPEWGVRAIQQSEVVTYVYVQRRQWITGRQCPTPTPPPHTPHFCKPELFADSRRLRTAEVNFETGIRIISLALKKKKKNPRHNTFMLISSTSFEHQQAVEVSVIYHHWSLVCKQFLKSLRRRSLNTHFPNRNIFPWRLKSG